MSLPRFDVQGSLFESLGSIAADLFDHKDKYKLFATKVWPLLASRREELVQCYEPENGRPGISTYAARGVTGAMPHPVLHRMEYETASSKAFFDAA